jgi:hypothetical protein
MRTKHSQGEQVLIEGRILRERVRKQSGGKNHEDGPQTIYIEEMPPGARLETVFAYTMDWEAVDERIDAGMTDTPVRGLPKTLIPEIQAKARSIRAKYRSTDLKAKEYGISHVYQEHRYVPSWNAPVFPETQFSI